MKKEKEKEKEFLKYLHSLESDFRDDLFSQEQLKTVEAIRFKFIEKYQEK